MRNSTELKILKQLEKLSQDNPNGIAAEQLSQVLALSRNHISHSLNQLHQNYLVERIEGRPVLWRRIKTQKHDCFSEFVGYKGSMRKLIEQCRIAVKYPEGLPILIHGKTGVGKSYLARLIHRFAVESNELKEDAPFITLNCADYANNPQLLTGVLFGYKKGAFTGADQDHEGMVSIASEGYLFLDEFHRLSAENQEKLFQLMDSGEYRRLGESGKLLFSKVRLIMATTESIEDHLLATLRRRIPVTIEIPDLNSRPLDEKFQIISLFLMKEALILERNIILHQECLRYLLGFNWVGNIGALENTIKLACAKAFFYDQDSLNILVDVKHLDFDSAQVNLGERYISVEDDLFISKDDTSCKLGDVSRHNHPVSFVHQDIENNRSGDIHALISKLMKASEVVAEQTALLFDSKSLDLNYYRIFSSELMNCLNQYGLSLNEKDTKSIYGWIYVFEDEIFKREALHLLDSVKTKSPLTHYIAQSVVKNLDCLNLSSPELLTFLLVCFISISVDESRELQGIIVAHGDSSAKSIAKLVNNLCHSFIFVSFDMDLMKQPDFFASEVADFVGNYCRNKDIILMFDMGSLSNLYSLIKNKTSGNLLVINNISTAIALNVGLMIHAKKSFNEIVRSAPHHLSIEHQFHESSIELDRILITSISGSSIAKKIRDIFRRHIDHTYFDVQYYDDTMLKTVAEDSEVLLPKGTRLILTTMPVDVKTNIDILSVTDIFREEGDLILKKLLGNRIQKEEYELMKEDLYKFLSVEGAEQRLSFLNPKVIVDEVEEIIKHYEQYFKRNFDIYVRTNLHLHISAMIERLMVDEIQDLKAVPIKDAGFIKATEQFFKPIIQKYKIQLNQNEIALLYAFMKEDYHEI